MGMLRAALMTGIHAHAQDPQYARTSQSISDLLCVPKLIARLAVSEASLQRLHGSPSEGQPDSARWGSRAAQGPTEEAALTNATDEGQNHHASVNPGKQKHAAFCRCAQRHDTAEKGHCQVEQILGISCPAGSTLLAWEGCFELLDLTLAQEPRVPRPEGVLSCAQECASMAESLRGTLKGLPLSSMGVATACFAARATSAVAARRIHQDVSLLQPLFLLSAMSAMPLPMIRAVKESFLGSIIKIWRMCWEAYWWQRSKDACVPQPIPVEAICS